MQYEIILQKVDEKEDRGGLGMRGMRDTEFKARFDSDMAIQVLQALYSIKEVQERNAKKQVEQ